MHNNHTFAHDLWRMSFSAVLSLGLCVFYFANITCVFADVPDDSPIYQQSVTGINTPAEKSGQPLALPTVDNSSPSMLSTFFHIVLNLGLIIGFIFVTVWCLKIFWEKRGVVNGVDETKPIKLLTSTYLAPRKAIHLVEVGNRILVLGVGNDEITRLDVITDPAEMETIRQATQAGFPNILERLIHREVTEKTNSETEKIIAESSSAVNGYAEKIKRTGRKRRDQNELPEDQA